MSKIQPDVERGSSIVSSMMDTNTI